jgi:D-tyrosyl-tRNA(Tyr) deacylase
MRAVIQRVGNASVTANGVPSGSIGRGLLVLLGIEDADGEEDVEWLCRKVAGLRVFDDADGVMNLSVRDVGGGILLVSQFTLMASTRKGNRPSYARASRPEIAEPLYERAVAVLSRELGAPVATGVFGADMRVSLVNEGPVTIIIDTKLRE